MSKELIERLRIVGGVGDEAADLIEAQQKRIEELEAKMSDDWCGCVGIHNHRLGVCTTCNKPVIGWWEVAKSAIEELAAAQAQLKDVRAVLEVAGEWLDEYAPQELLLSIADVLSQPTDDSALRELLKAERERCAKVADEYLGTEANQAFLFGTKTCAAKIRAMEDV